MSNRTLTAYCVRYAVMVISRNAKVHSHGSVAPICVVCVCIAVGAAFGIGLLLEIQFSVMIFGVAFLLLGIGVDDTFVIHAAFEHPDVRYPEFVDMRMTISSFVSSFHVRSSLEWTHELECSTRWRMLVQLSL